MLCFPINITINYINIFNNKTSNNALMISNIQSYNLCSTKSSINIYYNSILQYRHFNYL